MRLLEIFGSATSKRRFMVFAVAVLLTYPHPIAAQSVGPSGCVANCGSGGGGGGYNPYAGAAAGALGAFMNGFMNQMLKQPSPKQRAYALNEQGNAASKRRDYVEAVRLYEAALRLSPHDSVIRENLKSVRDPAGWQVERRRKEAEAKRKMDTAKRNVSQILGDFSQQLDAAESSGPELAMMDFNDPKLSPEPTLEEEKSRVGARLGEIEDKILNVPAGQSTWDGGYGGTLDSPEAAGVSKPATQTDVAILGARVPKEEKPKNAHAAVSLAGMLAKKEDYDGALRYLKEAKLNNPDQPGLDETIAYVKEMKAAKFPADRSKSPSPKAEIILDALTVGDGNWQASIRYLEGMKHKAPDDPHVGQALNYTRGMYDYQILKQSRTIDPELDKEAPLFFSGKPSSPKPDRAMDEQLRTMKKEMETPPGADDWRNELIIEPALPSRPGVKPPKVDQALLDRFEGPEGRDLARHLMDQEVRRILKGIDEKYIRTTAGEGLDAIGREDFATAHRIFGSLHQEYPDDINLRDTANYVAGLYHAQQRTE